MMRRLQHRTQKTEPRISAVVAVYNKPRELSLVLEGFRRQSRRDFELIVADDGSGPEIEKLYENFARSAPFDMTWIWQKDSGWGKPRMLNWSILEARAQRIVFTDGDCIPHRHFVRGHLEEPDAQTALCGRRVDLMEKVSPEITWEDVHSGKIENLRWLWGKVTCDEIDFGWQGLHLPGWLAKPLRLFSKKPTLLGSNLSASKQVLMDINGFDESFTVPGVGEDTDLQRRLELARIPIRWITYRAIQYHLWHKLTQVGHAAHKIFEDLKRLNKKEAARGLREFLPAHRAAFP